MFLKIFLKANFFSLIAIYLTNLTIFAFEPKILWFFDTKDASFGQTSAGDIDGDGKFELVFGCYRNDGNIYALNAEDGSLLWKFSTARENTEGCYDVAPLLFDINNDEIPEVIVPSSCNPKTFCIDGKTGDVIWTTNTNGSDSPPTIADLDNDNQMEILHGEFGGSVLCIDAKTGIVKWRLMVNPNSWIQTAPTIADLDLDGNLDFIVATWVIGKTDTNSIVAFRGFDGKMLWKTMLPATVYHGTCVTELDEDQFPELCIGDYSGKVYCIEGESGEIKWTYSANYYVGAPVISADLNSDGLCELIFSDAYGIGALDRNGQLLWYFQNPDLSTSFRGPAISDIDADGKPDIIFGTSSGYLRAIKGEDGKLLFEINLQEHYQDIFEIDNAPVVADFNNDGKMEAFIIGGKANYPNFSSNYGRAYMVAISERIGTDWLMFQGDIRRQSNFCKPKTSVVELQQEADKTFQKIIINDKNELSIPGIDFGSIQKISVFNIFGRNIYIYHPDEITQKNHCNILSLPELSKGLYQIRISTNNKNIVIILLNY